MTKPQISPMRRIARVITVTSDAIRWGTLPVMALLILTAHHPTTHAVLHYTTQR